MNKTIKSIIWIFIIMIIAFFISAIFFTSSNLLNFETGEVNFEVIEELNQFSNKFWFLDNISFQGDFEIETQESWIIKES